MLYGVQAQGPRFTKLLLTGKSGQTYEFTWHHRGEPFEAHIKKGIAAVYAVTHYDSSPSDVANHKVIYVGESHDVHNRFEQHQQPTEDHRPKWEGFLKHRANCILIHRETSRAVRKTIEQELRLQYDPPCNRE